MGNMREKQREAKARAVRMVELYENNSLRAIGEMEGISAERVRQILKKHGVRYKGSPRQKACNEGFKQRIKAQQDKVDANSIRTFGSTRKQINKLPSDKVARIKLMYRQFKRTALKKGHACKININQYWSVWAKSRKFDKRGTGKNNYTLTRIDFEKDITLNNIIIEKRSSFAVRIGTHAAKYRGCHG